MAGKQHAYTSLIRWTGNRGEGTANYRGYDRSWDIAVPGKPVIPCANDPLLGGDPTLMNPEDLLLSSLSACHMLWYLHLASNAGIIVHAYEDHPLGEGNVEPNGAGRFERAVLRPRIELGAGSDVERAGEIHFDVHKYCFIARSVNFPISYEPVFTVRPH